MMKLFQFLKADSNPIAFSNTSLIGSRLVASLPEDLLSVPQNFHTDDLLLWRLSKRQSTGWYWSLPQRWISILADILYNFRVLCDGSKWEIAQGMFLMAHKISLTFH